MNGSTGCEEKCATGYIGEHCDECDSGYVEVGRNVGGFPFCKGK